MYCTVTPRIDWLVAPDHPWDRRGYCTVALVTYDETKYDGQAMAEVTGLPACNP